MAGNSKRKGAVRDTSGKKSRALGSGAERRKGLKGKGPTPKAEDREGHITKKRKDRAVRAEAKRAATSPSRPERAVESRGRTRSSVAAPNGNEFVLGRNPVVEALGTDVPARILFVQAKIDPDPRVEKALALAVKNNIEISEQSRNALDGMAQGLIHQGLVLEVPAYKYADLKDLLEVRSELHSGMVVALDGITDPHNLGAIARSAAAFGGTGIVLPERRSVGVNATAWKTSAGTLAHIDVAQVKNLSRAIDEAKKAGFFVIGLAGGTADLIDATDIGKLPVMLVVGSEGKGLGRLVAESCDVVARIPMASRIESLNASVATGIALYELTKQRGI